jgi:DNA invertase Pin-like site-specific DNA recombinase
MTIAEGSCTIVLNGQEKISSQHLARLAYVYLRQSSPGQVAHHRESQINQVRMADRARQLGWEAASVHIIHTDQGLSGQSSDQRQGFQQLLSEVSLGKVGIIFGYEVSRLARNNSDWYRLLEAAAVFDTLIADYDGIYDLHQFNDRLLLGLKGTMSEAELHLLRLRLEGGRKRQLERGDYRQGLPTGLTRLPDGSVIQDPDEQIRHMLQLVFQKFAELGSCNRVLLYLQKQAIYLPRRQMAGRFQGDILWKAPTYGAIYAILTNPAYAGTLVYGRKQAQRGTTTGRRVRKPSEAWHYVHHDAYPGYITWATYLANQEQLRRNRAYSRQATTTSTGAAREGAALLQGIAWCGQCGHRLETIYKPHPRYTCQTRRRRFGEASCAFLGAPAVDRVVVQAFFEAIQPAQLDALAGVLKDQQAEHDRLRQQWQDRLQRVIYEAHRAERQYNAVDPENRLVAAELERRWEAALRHLQETETAYAEFEQHHPPATLPPQLGEQFRHISQTLPLLWDDLPHVQQKELLRSLIAQVTLTRQAPDDIVVKIVWVSGHYSLVHTQPPILRNQDVTGYEQMIACIHELWQQQTSDGEIAARLNAQGFHSAKSDRVSAYTVQRIRTQHGWHRPTNQPVDAPEGYLKIAELAQRLDVKPMWVYQRIRSGKIDPQWVTQHPLRKVILIRDSLELIDHLRQMKSE